VKLLARHACLAHTTSFKGFLGYLEDSAEDINEGDNSVIVVIAASIWGIWPFALMALVLVFVVWYVGHIFDV
jgi:hypothetical protein